MREEMSLDSKTVTSLILLVCTLLALGLAYYFYSQTVKLRTNASIASQAENQSLIKAVGKLIVLPDGEQPTIATVVDPEKLKAQPFFAKASKDDKVLIFTNAKKAILYSPSQNKIIEVAPISIGAPTDGTAVEAKK